MTSGNTISDHHGSVQPLDAAVVNPEVAMDGYMSVPRQVVYSPRLRQLVVTPVAEVEQLRAASATGRIPTS